MPFRPTHPEYEPRPAFDNSHSTPGSTAREPARNREKSRIGARLRAPRIAPFAFVRDLAEPRHFRQPPTSTFVMMSA